MTSRSYFGKMNSTLGSVVPLAMFCLNFLLHSWIHDIVHANDPIDNRKRDCNNGADEVRHDRCSSKFSFSFLALLLSIPGN